MLNSKTISSLVNDYYSGLQTKILAIRTENRKILDKIEGFNSLESEIGALKFEIAKANYNGETDKIVLLENEILAKKEQLNKIINSANLHRYTYECPICKDTGIINGKRCKCYLKRVSNVILSELGISDIDDCSFECAKKITELKKHYQIGEKYANAFPSTKINNLILSGNVGSGKTHLAKCIFKTVTLNGYNTLFLSATELNNIFIKMHVGEIDRAFAMEMLTDCDLLVIDDLGTEPLYKSVTVDYLLSIISYRIQRKKHFIITTNLTNEELYSRYNERLLSRLSNSNETLFMPFKNLDLRRK